MGTFFMALFAIMLMLVLVIGLHEAGHAIAAKLCGVAIQRISIGFGKPLLRWQGKQGCEWVWAMWPLGGYVQLLNTRILHVDTANYPRCFDKQPVWIRIFILISGALANLLVAWFALTLFFMLGYPRDIPVVQEILPNSIAAIAGIKAQDRIIEVAGQETNSWQEVGMRFIVSLGQKTVPVKVVSADQTVHVACLDLGAGRLINHLSLFSFLGLKPSLSNQNHETVDGKPFIESACLAIRKASLLLGFFLLILKQLVTGAISFSMLLGPFSLLAVSVGSFMQGMPMFLYFIASLSLAVGLVNLFPIPILDGGSILYALVEKIRGQPVSIAFEILLHRLVLIALFIMLMQLVMNDVQRYLGMH